MFRQTLLVCAALVAAASAVLAQQFVHPGVIHTQGDLDRIRAKVAAAEEPWASGYSAFAADSRSSSSYPMQGPFPLIKRGTAGEGQIALGQWENDCGAAYQNAIRWIITGNAAHADKARQILVGWASTCTAITGADARLTAGLQGHKFIAAAEILRHGTSNGVAYAGWSAGDTTTASDFIRNVLLPLNRMHGGGNWGIIGAIGQMAAGVFLDDAVEFNEAVNVLKFGAPTEIDAGIPYYIEPGGWTMEADRDIGHWALGINNLTIGAHIAWCQGIDLWTYQGNRLLVAQEYINHYNDGGSVSYTAGVQADSLPNGNLTIIGRGRWDISYQEQAFYPYRHYFGIPAPETQTAVGLTRAFFAGNTSITAEDGSVYSGWYDDGIPAERYDRDHPGFGTLLFALPERDPALPQVPAAPSATWGNGQVVINWAASEGATAYNVKRSTSRGGPFTTVATGLGTTSFTDGGVANGNYYDYRISATNAAGESGNSGAAEAFPSAVAPTAPATLSATATGQNRIDLLWSVSPGATGYTIKQATSAGGPFTTIATGVGSFFPRHAVTGLLAGRSYWFVVAATNSIGEGAPSPAAAAVTLPALPAGWSCVDLSYQTTPARATYAGNAFTVRGAGLDYGGNRVDVAGFVSMDLTGDGEIVARLASRQNYSVLSKIGLAMRETTAAGSKHVFLRIDGYDTADMVYRTATNSHGSASGTVPVSGMAAPAWLKLVRSGGVFTGSVSPDGVTWTQVHSLAISMAATIKAGFAVCSRNNGMLDTGIFDQVSITGWVPPVNADVQAYDFSNGSDVWDLSTANWDSSTVPWINGNKAVFGGSGETVTVNGDVVAGGITFNSGGYNLANGSAAALTLDAATVAVTNSGDVATVNEVLAGSAGFSKAGEGTLHLRNANSYSGDTTVNSGTLRVGDGTTKTFLGADSAAGTNRAMVASGATLEVSGNNSRLERKEIRLSGSGVDGTRGALHVDATGTTNGIRLNHNNTNPATAHLDSDAIIRIDGAGAAGPNVANVLLGRLNLGGHTLTKTGNGVLSFELAGNSITGPGKVVVAAGVLKSNQNNTFNDNFDLEIQPGAAIWAIQTGNVHNSSTANVIVNGTMVLNARGDGNPANGTDTTNATNTLGNLSGSGTITSGIWDNTGNNTLTLAPSGDCTFAGKITQSSGTVNLVKSGTATVTLSGNTDFNGTTTVNGGTLRLTGTHANPGNTVVANDATLVLSTPCLSDTATLSIGSGAHLQLDHASSDSVGSLVVDGAPVPDGLYGGASSGAPNVLAAIAGTGRILVGPRSLPGAVADSATVAEDESVTIAVLANDGDADMDPLAIQSVTQGAHGTVVIAGDQVTYTPAPNWNGSDSFSYTITDNREGTATASVTVTVSPVSDAPAFGLDSDQDGLDDVLEFVLGTDILTPDSSGVVARKTGDNLIVSFSRDDISEEEGLQLFVEVGSTIDSWPQLFQIGNDTGSSSQGVTIEENGGEPDTITVTIPAQGFARLFARVRVVAGGS